ncbi:MAG: hypothetical protein AAF809_06830 [Bacteroidota bacterium]
MADPVSSSLSSRAASSRAASPSRLDRLQGLVERTLRRTLMLAAVSSVAAAVLWWIVAGRFAAAGQVTWWLAGIALVPLLLPAAGTWLAVDTVRGVLRLPDVLRGMLSESKTQATVVRAEKGTTRAVGFVRLLWALRALATDAHGKAIAALALFRLSRLPLLLAAVAAFALNLVVILAAAVAVLIVLL